MSLLHLVTGYAGKAHITSADQGWFNAGCFGTDEYVLSTGERFKAEIVSNNLIKIYDGSLLMNGRHALMMPGIFYNISIANGEQGKNRKDLIVARYTRNQDTGVEDIDIVAITGTAVAGIAADPYYNDTAIFDGAFAHDMPLYRVHINSLSISKVEPLFNVLTPMSEMQHTFYKQNMLINGDFQCNQRGKKQYDATGKVMYTLDMWRAYEVIVDVLNEGVKLCATESQEVGYFTQFIQLGKLKGINYTISAMVDDEICTFTVAPGATAKEKSFGTFSISALTTSTWDNDLNDYNNKLKININPHSITGVTIKYIDVFEGDIAYPHVKEDPATAMMRCKRYIQDFKYLTMPSYTVGSVADNKPNRHSIMMSFDQMHTKPTIRALDGKIYNKTTGAGVEFDKTKGLVEGLGNDYIWLTICPDVDTLETSVVVAHHFLLSCEHNPDGD